MPLKSSKVASLVLSGVITVAGFAGVGRPIAQAETEPTSATPQTSEKTKQPTQTPPPQPERPKASSGPKATNPKIKKSA
ncbi:MAG: hypothetical protein AAFQ76_19490, partial [Cyanobacteria bacterium J06626_26]